MSAPANKDYPTVAWAGYSRENVACLTFRWHLRKEAILARLRTRPTLKADSVLLDIRSALSSRVQENRYPLSCLRYMELNPLRAGMVTDPGDYRWSSYRAHASDRNY
jgi:hypothetical protein